MEKILDTIKHSINTLLDGYDDLDNAVVDLEELQSFIQEKLEMLSVDAYSCAPSWEVETSYEEESSYED